MSDATKPNIRTDIQVMRAVAVLAVIISHFWPSLLPGGFAGVDVFFVISGFLITSLLIREVEQTGAVRLSTFWVRRIRRIMPATITVIATTTVVVHIIGLPTQLKIVTNHAIASTFSAINFVLAWESTDYNARTNATSPLQHLWSLAVEEQFYVVWPVLIAALAALTIATGRNFRSIALVSSILIIAFSLSVAALSTFQGTGSYFEPFSRAWELSAGAFVAITGNRLPRLNAKVVSGSRFVLWSLLVVAMGIGGLDNFTPGLGVFPAVALAAALIALPPKIARQSVPIRRGFLHTFTWIGDRSFSLYLWHWPALILAPYLVNRNQTTIDALVVLILILGISDLTYRFVENPVRFSRLAMWSRPTFVGSIAALTSLALTVGILALPTTRGESRLPSEFPTTMLDQPLPDDYPGKSMDFPYVKPHCGGAAHAVFDCPAIDTVTLDPFVLDINPPYTPGCPMMKDKKPFECLLGSQNSSHKIAFVGDSHSRTWWKAIDTVGKRAGASISLIFRLGCGYRAGLNNKCGQHNEKVKKALVSGGFDLVLITQVAHDEPLKRYVDAFSDLINNNVPVVIIADNTHVDWDLRKCIDNNFPDVNRCSLSRNAALDDVEPAVDAAIRLGIPVVNFSDIYCSGDKCSVSLGGMLIHVDRGHMFTSFAATLAPFLWSELKELGYLGQKSN